MNDADQKCGEGVLFDFAGMFVSVVGVEWPSVVNNGSLVKDTPVRMKVCPILGMVVGRVIMLVGMCMIRIVSGRMFIQMGMFVDMRVKKWGGMKMGVWQVSV